LPGALRQQDFHAFEVQDGFLQAFLHGLLQFIGRIAAAEIRGQRRVECFKLEFLVVRRVVAQDLGQGIVDALFQAFKARVPAIADVGCVEGAQLLDAPVDHVLGGVRTGLFGRAGCSRIGGIGGHAGDSFRTAGDGGSLARCS
jgi:hypothetical protein